MRHTTQRAKGTMHLAAAAPAGPHVAGSGATQVGSCVAYRHANVETPERSPPAVKQRLPASVNGRSRGAPNIAESSMSAKVRALLCCAWAMRVRWAALAVAALWLLSGCIFGRAEQRLSLSLENMNRAIGGAPSGEPRKLVYRVDGHAGRWLHEVVLEEGRYAEKRTRMDGRRFAFGYDERGAWLSVDGQDAVSVDGSSWDALARTRAAVYRLAFASPKEGDEVAWMGRDSRRWELAYRPAGGATINLSIDRRRHLPRELDTVDGWTRLVLCDRLAWEPSPDGVVLTQVRCGASTAGSRPTTSTDTRRLLSVQGLAHIPSWASPSKRRKTRSFEEPVTTEIADTHRIKLPVRINGRAPEQLILDSGAFHTIISEELAEAAGVMPTGEPPLFVDPPFLERSELWVGVVDTLQVGDAALHGERVLVARNPKLLGKEKGLLGRSFFVEFVVDVDSPAREVRVWDRSAFEPAADQKRIRLAGSQPRVDGAVTDVANGHILLDTGMPDNIVVHAPMMKHRHKRKPGMNANLSPKDGSGPSSDYYASIDGLRLGPFSFPAMGAIGRDKNRKQLGIGVQAPNVKPPDKDLKIDLGAIQMEVLTPTYGTPKTRKGPYTGTGIAIAGMGVMRYLRLSFDLRSGFVFASTGPAYHTLMLLGADIERGPWGPTVSRLIDGGPAERAGLMEGDVVAAINGVAPADTDDALTLIAKHTGFYCHLEVLRNGARRHINVDVAHDRTRR